MDLYLPYYYYAQGYVPVSDGSGDRSDASHVVVLDGLVSADERAALLLWLTEDGWQQGGGPPESKWERNCVDYRADAVNDGAGDTATWGLQQHVVQVRHPSSTINVPSYSALLCAYSHRPPAVPPIHLPVCLPALSTLL